MKAPEMLITGMGGMEGRHLARAAVEAGYKVSGTVHGQEPPELVELQKRSRLTVIPYDLMTGAGFLLALCRPDVIIHLAGHGIDNRELGFGVFSENVVMLDSVARAAIRLKKRPRLVLASSTAVYGKQDSPNPIRERNWKDLTVVNALESAYRGSKLWQEAYLDEVVGHYDPNFEYVIARPSQHMGPGRKPGVVEYDVANEIKRILGGGEPVIKVRNKLAEVDILDARDVALAYLLLASKGWPGAQYNIISGVPTTIEKLCGIMLEAANINPGEVQVQSTGVEAVTFARFSNAQLRNLGWEPKYTARDAIKSFWDWFKNVGKLV
jgi:nucleoside-diphosphate-sugar epimerase